MIIIISLGVALLFGLTNGVRSLRNSVDKFVEDYNYPNITISTNIENRDKLDALMESKQFNNVECRLAISTVMNKDDKILSVKAITYEDENLNNF